MSALPWMPLYIADYLADTGHLSTVEHGAYMLLIMHYWQHEGLPGDERRLARIARLSEEEWGAVRDTLADLFDESWRHGRIDHEIEAAKQAHAKRSKAGKAGASARYGNRTVSLDQSDNERMPRGGGCRSQEDTHSTEQEVASPREIEFSGTFWPAYPWKAGEIRARDAFIVARDRASLADLMAGLARYVAEKPKDRHWMKAETFLGEERWRDEIAPAPKAQSPPPAATTWLPADDPRWPDLAERYRRERGKPLTPLRSKHYPDPGAALPTEWIEPRAA